MTELFVEYNKATGAVRTEIYDGPDARRRALTARIASERLHAGRAEIEIVVLSGRSVEDIQHTHARYFQSVGQLAQQSLSA